MQDQVVEDEQAGDLGQRLVEERVVQAVAHLVDGQVVRPLAVTGEERPGAMEAAPVGKPRGVDALLVVEDVDLVAGGQQGQDVGAVVGDAGGRRRDRRQEREPAHRRASSASSWGPNRNALSLSTFSFSRSAVRAGSPSAGTGCSRVAGSTGVRSSTRTSLKPAAAAR